MILAENLFEEVGDKVGDTRADVLEPFFPSDIAIGGLQKGSK